MEVLGHAADLTDWLATVLLGQMSWHGDPVARGPDVNACGVGEDLFGSRLCENCISP